MEDMDKNAISVISGKGCRIVINRTGCTAAFLLCCIASVQAQEIDLELRVGGTYSDNIGLNAAFEEDQAIATAGATIVVDGETPRSEGNLVAAVDFQKFLDDAFPDEFIPDIQGEFSYKAIPDRFHWDSQARYGLVRRNPLGASTPENREEEIYISTPGSAVTG